MHKFHIRRYFCANSNCVDTVDGPGRDPELRPFSNRSRSLMIFMTKNPNSSVSVARVHLYRYSYDLASFHASHGLWISPGANLPRRNFSIPIYHSLHIIICESVSATLWTRFLNNCRVVQSTKDLMLGSFNNISIYKYKLYILYYVLYNIIIYIFNKHINIYIDVCQDIFIYKYTSQDLKIMFIILLITLI